MKRILLTLAILVSGAFAAPAVPNITGEQLRAMLIGAGARKEVCAELADQAYAPCRASWIQGDFQRRFIANLAKWDLAFRSAEKADCDDVADLFITLARAEHRKDARVLYAALPIGRIFFPAGVAAPTAHVLVWAVTSDEGLIFFDPLKLSARQWIPFEKVWRATRCSD